ncbi:MAG: aldo/keto reductase [Lachnospiraceae bacterium]|nr:aldo/keto reductase [Lachnospiraceae bacterium]
MNKQTDCFELSNGVKMPCVGFGTWQTPDGQVAEDAVLAAIQGGYRHIDTAAIYGNEESVGIGIKKSGVPREELFITTKLWNDSHEYAKVKTACAESLERLGLEYLDLYLIHWPNPPQYRADFVGSIQDTWKAMEELYAEGKVKAIGISNFLPHHMDAIKSVAKVIPMVNQIRLYPGFVDHDTIAYCRKENMIVQAYSPLGTGELLEAPALVEFAEKYKTTVAKLCLRWSLQMGFCPLPKSITKSRILDNIDIFDFEISGLDLEVLTNMKNFGEAGTDPDTASF